jgi:hypothetical protein
MSCKANFEAKHANSSLEMLKFAICKIFLTLNYAHLVRIALFLSNIRHEEDFRFIIPDFNSYMRL